MVFLKKGVLCFSLAVFMLTLSMSVIAMDSEKSGGGTGDDDGEWTVVGAKGKPVKGDQQKEEDEASSAHNRVHARRRIAQKKERNAEFDGEAHSQALAWRRKDGTGPTFPQHAGDTHEDSRGTGDVDGGAEPSNAVEKKELSLEDLRGSLGWLRADVGRLRKEFSGLRTEVRTFAQQQAQTLAAVNALLDHHGIAKQDSEE